MKILAATKAFSIGSNKSMRVCSDGYYYQIEYDGKKSEMKDIKSTYESVSFKNGKLNSYYKD